MTLDDLPADARDTIEALVSELNVKQLSHFGGGQYQLRASITFYRKFYLNTPLYEKDAVLKIGIQSLARAGHITKLEEAYRVDVDADVYYLTFSYDCSKIIKELVYVSNDGPTPTIKAEATTPPPIVHNRYLKEALF